MNANNNQIVSTTAIEIRNNCCLIKYGLDRIIERLDRVASTDDLELCLEATNELLQVTVMVKDSVDLASGASAVTCASPTLRPEEAP